jgi:hypothetical protein
MHAYNTISIYNYLNLLETPPNHLVDHLSTLTYTWSNYTVASPLFLVL